jgi:hypothetical protein
VHVQPALVLSEEALAHGSGHRSGEGHPEQQPTA